MSDLDEDDLMELDDEPDEDVEQKPTKIAMAWERLFEQHRILEQVATSGRYEITAAQINQVHESRLMAKFDQYPSLPPIFRKNQLSILPLSRSRYVIGPFHTHKRVPKLPDDHSLDPIYQPLPANTTLQSLDPTALYSEAAAINYAHISGMIADAVGDEECVLTVSGRMTTPLFGMTIRGTKAAKEARIAVEVDRAQCEVDAGFEGLSSLILLEAKNLTMETFMVRQLYYPYRLWRSKVAKPVVPVLMTYSNDVFDFFVYEFTDDARYDSLRLVRRKRYAALPQDITQQDIIRLLDARQPASESVTFPQANIFERVVDLLETLAERGSLTFDEVTERNEFSSRQTGYYTNAARYLGLVEKSADLKDPNARRPVYRLTASGRRLFSQQSRRVRYLGIIERIIQHEVFYHTVRRWSTRGYPPDKSEVVAIMRTSGITIGGQTLPRRAETVLSWAHWIFSRVVDET